MARSRWGGLISISGIIMLVGCFAEPAPPPQATIELSATPRATEAATLVNPTPDWTPTPTACTINLEWQDTYTVQGGDTLAQIAYLLGISVDALLEGNCLTNPDFVFVGQLLHVPNAFALGIATNPDAAIAAVLFVRKENSFQNLWGVRSNGVAPQRLTNGMYINAPPARSADLTQVALRGVSAFHAPPEDSAVDLTTLPSDIWLVATDGAGLRLLVDQGPFDTLYRSTPTWSPDGSLLAFTEQHDATGSLIVVQPNGRNRQVVYTADFAPPNHSIPITPVWSPDGTQLAVVTWDDESILATLSLLSPEARALPDEQHRGFVYHNGPLWVPLHGLNGRPAVAVEVINQQLRLEWRVVDIERGTVDVRQSGLRLVDATVEWFAEQRAMEVVIYNTHGVPVANLPTMLAHLSFAPDGAQLMAGLGEGGMDYLRLDEALRQNILSGSVLYPVWAAPQYVVLP